MQITVRVKAGAKNDRLQAVGKDYEISVRAKAAGGRANNSVLTLLSGVLGVPQKNLRIVRGLRSPTKTIEIRE